MNRLQILKSMLVGGASVITLMQPAAAKVFDIPDGDLSTALIAYVKQSNLEVLYADDTVRGRRSRGARGDYSEIAALTQILKGTGLAVETTPSNALEIVSQKPKPRGETIRVAAATPRAPAPAAVETVVVTAQHKSENIQNVPIAVTALSQAQLTARQIAGGPDLLRDVPNMNFTKTNFSGYDIELRGIGTQAISVTTDPAVAVAFNDTPFIRNHFFEQEFFDLQDVEVLLGPQGTLYGRNATAGVVNLKSALPDDSYEAMLSADMGNFSNRRLEAMLNIPIVGDKLDIRFAGEWTKREGYTEDTTLGMKVDGRDLWSGRMTIGWKPTSDLQTYFVWEHFQEDDDRLRSGKQLCKTSNAPTSVNGVPVPAADLDVINGSQNVETLNADYLSQGCESTSLYAPSAFEVPDGFSLPFNIALSVAENQSNGTGVHNIVDPYASTVQSTNLRSIQSALLPSYKAKNDTLEFNATYNIISNLALTSQSAFSQDFLWSTEDYNRFDTSPGIFRFNGIPNYFRPDPLAGTGNVPADAAIFCDPQLGCSDRIIAEDLSEEHSWQLSQEFRLASNFAGPLNFNVGGNYLHYETEENYYVFINALSAYSVLGGGKGIIPDNSQCIQKATGGHFYGGWQNPNPALGGGEPTQGCVFIDTNPISSLNNKGHNYFLSQNPYTLNSYAMFGELYYNITNELKLTGGLRWTIDQKHFTDIPSEVISYQSGYPVTGIVDQAWQRLTGRSVLDWTPKLDFTDQTLVYLSYSHGYKAGGANPPGAIFSTTGTASVPFVDHPVSFKPEYIEAFELGTKNTLLDNSLTLNGDIFYYNYTGYQVSEIVDRTAINNNYNAHAKGVELTANWEPIAGLRFNLAGGWEDTSVAGGTTGIDLMNRTAGMPGWMVVKPFPTQASNCIVPTYVVQALLEEQADSELVSASEACAVAYNLHLDPVTGFPYVPNPTLAGGNTGGPTGPTYAPPSGYLGFDPLNPAINNGEGFAKNLAGHELPNAPPFTLSFGGEYTVPVSEDWTATFRGDFYWQADSWARIFNDNPYDRLHGYTNLNLALILSSANGWQVMGYIKNVFNTTAITGDFLNSDDTGLTTNVFLTDPRLYGVRVTKQLDDSDGFWGSDYSGAEFFTGLFSDKDGGSPPLWIEVGAQEEHIAGQSTVFPLAFLNANPMSSVLWDGTSPTKAQESPLFAFGENAKVSYEPEGTKWILSASIRVGRSSNFKEVDHQTDGVWHSSYYNGAPGGNPHAIDNFSDTRSTHRETHAILDFMAGKDVGLGMFGLGGSSVLSGGVRVAQFAERSSLELRARPDLHFKYYPSAAAPTRVKLPLFHTYHVAGHTSRKFHGVGPSISWQASAPITGGNPPDGEVSIDWGANAALLFGRQRTSVQHHNSGHYVTPFFVFVTPHYFTAYNLLGGHTTSRSVAVPNLGGFAGISYRYNNAKISLGYRADFFFGAIDGGIDNRHSETLNMSGPFATISFGLGG